MSRSGLTGAAGAACGTDATAAGMVPGAGRCVTTWVSSRLAAPADPFDPRLRRILKSCFSNSNSETEFFFIRSMIALISFKSTKVIVSVLPEYPSQLISNKKAASDSTLLFCHSMLGKDNERKVQRQYVI